MLNKRKKAIKFRGHHTHGYGSKKKHRGSGHQGGVGMAGTGKRADQKRPSIWKDPKYFGRYGFVSRKKNLRALNIFYIEKHFELLLANGKITKEGDAYLVNLKDFKVEKLLASGAVTRKYHIVTGYASKSAISKIEEKGGKVEQKTRKE
jgi:large subunit ribosomal protein L15